MPNKSVTTANTTAAAPGEWVKIMPIFYFFLIRLRQNVSNQPVCARRGNRLDTAGSAAAQSPGEVTAGTTLGVTGVTHGDGGDTGGARARDGDGGGAQGS